MPPNLSKAVAEYTATQKKPPNPAPRANYQKCPEKGCDGFLVPGNGCAICPLCGWSPCK